MASTYRELHVRLKRSGSSLLAELFLSERKTSSC